MPHIEVPWGDETLGFDLPDEWRLQPLARPQVRHAPDDWADQLARAMNQPVAGAPLGKRLSTLPADGRVVIVVEDLTRYSPLEQILPVVMREIRHAGIADERIEILFATGMHPPLTHAQAVRKIGPLADEIAWRCNPWSDESAYVDLGKTAGVHAMVDRGLVTADLRIIVSSVSPHLQAGFGGGYKMFFPGCGLLKQIRLLHRQGLHRHETRQLVGTTPEDNAMRRAIDAVGDLIDATGGQTFAIQYLLDDHDRPTQIAAGEPTPTHRMLVKQCAVACGVLQDRQVDLLITNAHPRDHDLWQAFKCIPNTCWAARPNGVVICLARCPAGLNEMEQMAWPLSPRWTRRLVRLIGPDVITTLMDRIVKRIAGDSLWFVRLATQILQRNPIYMVSPELHRQGAGFPGIALFADVPSALAAADKQLGEGPHSVAVFPAGGATYPITGR